MEFSNRRQRLAARSAHLSLKANSSLTELYPSPLQLYDAPPRDDISLEEFESLALERLKLLRVFEKNSSSYGSEWRAKVEEDIRSGGLEHFLQIYGHSSRSGESRRRDHLSHFILRLAYARTEELRRWFVSQEVDLFRFRFAGMSASELEDFLRVHKLNYSSALDPDELLLLGDKLRESNPFNSGNKYYKAHFTEALDLVRGRRAYLSNGFVYVPDSEIISLLHWTFKSLLTHNLRLTCKTLPNLDEDERLVRMLNNLDKRYVGNDYSTSSDRRVLPASIAPLSGKGVFPLCMKHVQDSLSREHHIKYKARIQYGLFLKGIGLTLEDALSFFRGEFTKSHVKLESFDKEYTYNIRYNYGLEGKKVNWAPWSCLKIIKGSVGPGENHGCPYRHHDQNLLRGQLLSLGTKEEDVAEILRFSREGHYQKACSFQFQAQHGHEISSGLVNHPNQYYLEATQGPNKENAPKNSSNPNVKSERVLVYNNTN